MASEVECEADAPPTAEASAAAIPVAEPIETATTNTALIPRNTNLFALTSASEHAHSPPVKNHYQTQSCGHTWCSTRGSLSTPPNTAIHPNRKTTSPRHHTRHNKNKTHQRTLTNNYTTTTPPRTTSTPHITFLLPPTLLLILLFLTH
ncbi:hypothetical protein Ae331Ps2_6371 [Pseudonocardia sp. Ae331_Ps2]|nr:hypothetical protein Ae331Ps2_6371 [Pseudonocardia sp. Ae331_Ps2]